MAKEKDESSEIQQMRAELAMLRATLQQQLDLKKAEEEAAKKMQEYQAWVSKTAEEKTQMVADAKFRGMAGDVWEVSLKEQPTVRLPAHSEYEAIGRYNDVCGILSTDHKHEAHVVSAAA